MMQLTPYEAIFKEDRVVDPVTGDTETYESHINALDYTYKEMEDACISFGYTKSQVSAWIAHKEYMLILECLFELEV